MDNKPWGADGHPRAPYNQSAYDYCTQCGRECRVENLCEYGVELLCAECLERQEDFDKLNDGEEIFRH